MKKMIFFILFLLIAGFSPLLSQKEFNGPVTIGFVIDGPWERNDELIELFSKEIRELLQSEFEVRFPAEKRLESGWSLEKIRENFHKLLSDDEVDIVIAGGEISTRLAVFSGDLPKPVIAPFATNAGIHRMPVKNGASGVKNLNYITYSSSMDNTIKRFRELTDFSSGVIFVNREAESELEGIKGNFALPEKFSAGNTNITTIKISSDIDEAIGMIPAGADAVFNLPLMNLTPEQLQQLIAKVQAKEIPFFSMFDLRGMTVKAGAAAGLGPRNFFTRIARRIALNLQRILLGEEPGEIPVNFPLNYQLYINMETAIKLGVFPNWSVMADAELIGYKKEKPERTLTLTEAIKEAIEQNPDLKASGKNILISEENVAGALANLLPQLELSATGLLIDKDRAEMSNGQQAEKSVTATAQLQQVIFSEKAWANLDITGLREEINRYEFDRDKLETILEVSNAYLNLMKAKNLEAIQKENLNRSMTNYEIARFRNSVGSASPSEVYRWESEIASNKKSVIESNASRNLAEINLNRILNRPSEEAFDISERELDELIEQISEKRFLGFYENKWYFKIMRKYFVGQSFINSPELKIVNKAIEIQERRLSSAKSTFFLPTLALQGTANQSLYKGGAGSGQAFMLGYPLPQPKDFNWTLALNLSLPLYSGGSRFVEKSLAGIEISKLKIEKESIKNKLEQNIRSQFHLSGASFAGMKEADKAAKAAYSTLELVVDSYQRGAVSIVELIDAQNAALISAELAVNARVDFIQDLMNLMRATGKFIYLEKQSEIDRTFSEFKEFFEVEIEKIKGN